MTKKLIAIVMALTVAIGSSFALCASETGGEPAISTTESTTSTPSVEVIDTESTSTESTVEVHTHNWYVFGSTDTGLTIVCDGCKGQYNMPFAPCEHQLIISVDDHNSNLHRYECKHCDYLARLPHSFEFMVDESSHFTACIDCGYVSYEEFHTFETLAFDHDEHTVKCTTCGYIHKGEHLLEGFPYDDYTEVRCMQCDYIAAKQCHHENTYMIGELNHVTLCTRCSNHVDEQHNFYQGVCECGYEAVESTQYGIVTDFNRAYDYKGDRILIIEMLIDHEVYEFYCDYNANYREWVDEGSFVEIKLNGNEITAVELLVDYDVVDDAENFSLYTSNTVLDTYSIIDEITFEDLIIEDIEPWFDELLVEFDRLTTFFPNDYKVYDLRDGDMGNLREGDAVLYFTNNGTTYFIVIW